MGKSIKAKSPNSSEVTKTGVVCPDDANPMDILQGVRLVEWMDVAGAVCAQTHAEKKESVINMKKRRVELLSPVGSFDCLQAAINAGADAAYFGVKQLNMRTRSSNSFFRPGRCFSLFAGYLCSMICMITVRW